MAAHFSALLGMPASARSPINPLRRPPLTTGHHPPLPARCCCYCHCCMPDARTLPVLRCYYAPNCTLNQSLPLLTAMHNSAACLTHSTICTTAAPPQVARRRCCCRCCRCCRCCMPATCALPALRCYCAPTALSISPYTSQRLTQPHRMSNTPNYLYDCGSTISLLAADAATAAARALYT
jgi:hypothetical protein